MATVTNSAADATIYEANIKDFPSVDAKLRCPRNPDALFNTLGPIFLFFPTTILFFGIISSVVDEKEKHLKESLEMVGMTPVVFWLGHYLSMGTVMILNALLTTAIGYACKFSFFANTDFGVRHSSI